MARERINPALKKMERPLAGLRQDPENVRLHDERSLSALVESLRRFGQQKPVGVDGDGVVVAGNGLVEAARALGWKRIAAVRFDGEGDAQRLAFALADNRTAELSEWDYKRVSAAMAELVQAEFDLTVLGWSSADVENLLKATWPEPEPATETAAAAGDEVKTLTIPHSRWRRVAKALALVRRKTGKQLSDEGALAYVVVAWGAKARRS